jgi:peptidoglycan/LPS O-acetylase OafA/YrhL
MRAPAVNAANPPSRLHYFPGLDGLRAIMALWVLFGHTGNFMGWQLGAYAPAWAKPMLLTSVPVNVFICLSGFVIFQMMRQRRWTNYRDYLTQRGRRILPIYWVAMMLSFVMIDFRLDLKTIVPWYAPAAVQAAQAQAAVLQEFLWHHVAAHVVLAHGLIPEVMLPRSSEAILAPAWSLSLEWQFYLIAPLLYFWIARGALHFLGLVLLLGAASLTLPLSDHGLTAAFFLVSWPYFALGWLSSRLLDSMSQATRSEASMLALGFGVAVATALGTSSDTRATLLSIAIWALAWLACCMPQRAGLWGRAVRALLGHRFLVATGKRSYSLYLMHVLVLDVMAYVLIRTGLLNASSAAGFLTLLIPTLVMTLLVTWFTYTMIELRFMHRPTRAPSSA